MLGRYVLLVVREVPLESSIIHMITPSVKDKQPIVAKADDTEVVEGGLLDRLRGRVMPIFNNL